MITARAFAGKSWGVYGLARSGRACVAALLASGGDVLAWDDSAAARDAAGVTLTDLNHAELDALEALVTSPGVPHHVPLLVRARDEGCPVIGDIELFAQARPELPPHRVVGITGTNGKSTTTALVHHIVASAGIPARLGGNIGLPILGQEPLPEGGVYVLELSSFQIDLTQSLDCDVAVLLNITPDHLDRHGTIAAYAAAKARLFDMQSPTGVAVIATEDSFTRAIAAGVNGKLVAVAAADIGPEATHWPSLQGPHNAQNAAAAIAACRALGIDDAAIMAGLASYPGLPHRMERVRERGGVLYVNDSKATNPTSTAPALAAWPAVHWIAGGQAKTGELDAALPHLGHVRAAYLIGEAAPLFGRLLGGRVPVVQSGTLAAAVTAAAAAAVPGEVVLLSPACASFDQFRDYEARGEAFRAAVEALP